MLRYAVIDAALSAFTVIIHAIGTTSWFRMIWRRYTDKDIEESRPRSSLTH